VDRSGKPLESQTKHTHGFAYAIGACASVYTATGDPSALELAQRAFAWIERCAHDKVNGGYVGFLKRDGGAILRPADAPYKTELDTVGTEIGLKDLNVHSDMLETFALLYRAWPDPLLRTRLDELVDIISDKMVVPSTGAMHFFVTADWRPLPHLIRVGYQCHSAYRLLLALGSTGDTERIRGVACRMIDSAIKYALDTNIGGFFYAVPGVLPNVLHAHDLIARRKTWWVQSEALKALFALSRIVPDEGRYLKQFERQWRYMKQHCFDDRHGGIYAFGLDGATVWQRKMGARLAPAWMTRKGDVWKDASHEGRALLFCLDALRAPAA
jgi:mannobiose 2-epimerase